MSDGTPAEQVAVLLSDLADVRQTIIKKLGHDRAMADVTLTLLAIDPKPEAEPLVEELRVMSRQLTHCLEILK